MKAWLDRLGTGMWPPRCAACGVEMTLQRDAEVCSVPPVCGRTTSRRRVLEAIH